MSNLLDYNGLKKILEKFKSFFTDKLASKADSSIIQSQLDSKVSKTELTGYVPIARTINNKPLSDDIIITADDLGIDTTGDYVTTTTFNNFKNGEEIKIGKGSSDGAQYSVSIGYNALSLDSMGKGTVTIGYNTKNKKGSSTIAIGDSSSVSGNGAISIGGYSETTEANALAIGYYAVSDKNNASAIGPTAQCHGMMSTSIGYNVTTSDENVIQLGGPGLSAIKSYKTSITLSSDIRDKTDIEPLKKMAQLNFFLKFNPLHTIIIIGSFIFLQ